MEHTAPDMSVIMPIDEVEEHLEACLDSVV